MNDGLDKKIVLGLALTLALLVATAVYWFDEPSRQQRVAQRYELATAEIFAQNCFYCHGEQGRGGVGPSLRGTRLDEEGLKKTISRGVTIMPTWAREEGGTLNSFEIQELVTFILNWDEKLMEEAFARHPIPGNPNPPPPAPPPPYAGMKPPFPWGDETAVEKGKLLYERVCARCHSNCHSAEATRLLWNMASPAYSQSLEEHPDYYFWMLSEGRTKSNMVMPSHKGLLPEKQRWQLLNYIWSVGKEYQ